MMRRMLDLSTLTEEEAEHVLQVVQRDMRLRKTEEERLSDLMQELDEEDSRCVLLSRQQGFNQRCCIRCCSPFTFLLKPRRRCLDCNYNICKRCCSYSSTDKGWLCSSCEKGRLLKTQSLEWFYSNVRRRFNRFGSAKVLRTLYRRHITEQGNLAELTEESTYDESLGNDDSMYESDSTFFKQTQAHSMAETISVALRVAEEAIDEAIAKAESQKDNQEKQNEACYLRDNRGELIEELTTTILQKIIHRKKQQCEMHPECNVDWPPDHKRDVNSSSSPTNRPRSAMASQSSPKTSLWRSRSALSLLTDEIWHQHDNGQQKPVLCKDCTQGLKKDGVSASILPSWKSVDRMDNSILQSPDGNWIALQSTQLSRPSLLTKRKSLVFSVLEKESGVISAYDGMGSDTETDTDGTCGSALLEIRQKISSNNVPNDLQSSSQQPTLTSNTQTTAYQPQTHSSQDTPVPKFHKSPFPFLKRKVPLDCKRSSSQRLSIKDINFHPQGAESSEDGLEDIRTKRTRRRRRTKREDAEKQDFTTLSSVEPDNSRILLDIVVKYKSQSASDILSDQIMDGTTSDIQSSEVGSPEVFVPELENDSLLAGSEANQLTSALRELTKQVSKTKFSSTEDELGKLDETVGEGNDNVKREAGRVETLWEMEVDMKKEEVMANRTELQQVRESDKCPVKNEDIFVSAVEEGKKASKMDNSEKLIDHLHEIQKTIDTVSETTENLQDKCFDFKRLVTGEPTELEEIEVDSINNTDSEGQIKTTEDTVSCRGYRSNKVEERSERNLNNFEPEQVKKCNTTDEAMYQEPDNQSLLETEKQRDVDGEENGETENQKDGKQMKETERTTKSEDSIDGAIKEMTDETEQDICDYQEITGCLGEDVAYERMIDSAIRVFDNMEKDTEALDSNTRIGRSGDTDRSEQEVEILAGEKNEKEIMKCEEIEDRERMHGNKLPEERFVEEESKHDLAEETELHNCVGNEVDCDQIFKEDLNGTLYGQQLFLTPEEIYKGAHNLDLEKDLEFCSSLLQQKYTAASLRSITTEVLKVLNATEDLIQGAIDNEQSGSQDLPVLPPAQSKQLDEQRSRLEENVYVAASSVFGLEVELDDLEECARSISAATSDGEISHLEEQVATVAAHVQQSELEVTDIAARIAALKSAGLNVAPQTRFTKPQTIDSSRQQRRRLPAPPMQDKKV